MCGHLHTLPTDGPLSFSSFSWWWGSFSSAILPSWSFTATIKLRWVLGYSIINFEIFVHMILDALFLDHNQVLTSFIIMLNTVSHNFNFRISKKKASVCEDLVCGFRAWVEGLSFGCLSVTAIRMETLGTYLPIYTWFHGFKTYAALQLRAPEAKRTNLEMQKNYSNSRNRT